MPDRRRRWPALLGATTVALLLVAALVGGPGLVVHFEPASITFEEDAPAVTVEGFGGPDGSYVVGYRHDTYTTLSIGVANGGPVAVEVVDVRLASQAAPLLVQPEDSEPVAVPASGATSVDVPVRFDNCEAYHEREAMVVEAVEVTARVWGRTVVEEVPLDRPMMARSPMLWQCPDRTIDRGDDRRTAG